ncbi:MAG: hypothetical protein Q7U07_08615 [Gammaproteobacteria bacterium]|nr:hypothetical protein [Gammaproteobacteria bacterium]
MTLDEEKVCFFAELGLAINSWSNIEDKLRLIVLACLKEKDRNAISLGFLSIENFRSKLEFVDKVLGRTHLRGAHFDDWQILADRTRRASAHRNKLAHWRMREIVKGKAGRRLALEPWIFLKKDMRKAGDTKPLPRALCLRDIVKVRYEFVALQFSLGNLCSRLNNEPERHSKSDELAPHPPTIRSIKLQILGEHELQRISSEKKS